MCDHVYASQGLNEWRTDHFHFTEEIMKHQWDETVQPKPNSSQVKTLLIQQGIRLHSSFSPHSVQHQCSTRLSWESTESCGSAVHLWKNTRRWAQNTPYTMDKGVDSVPLLLYCSRGAWRWICLSFCFLIMNEDANTGQDVKSCSWVSQHSAQNIVWGSTTSINHKLLELLFYFHCYWIKSNSIIKVLSTALHQTEGYEMERDSVMTRS